ncbi:MAG: transpeptidase family protein [Bacteroidetes bacterium]|nr:transpeptidase family protein [Bacteroidota bacterium]
MATVKKDIRFRVYIAFSGICLLAIAIILKAAMIQIKEGPELRSLAKDMHTRTTILPAERGNIYTEQGQLLCSTIPQFDVHIDFSVIKPDTFNRYVDTLAECMSGLFADASAAQYKKALTLAYNEKSRYWLLKKNLPYYQYQALRSFPIFSKGKRVGGFIEDPKIKRINPYGMLAYRTIGLWRENSQIIGLERTYDSVLIGDAGSRVEQKETGGVWMPVEGSEVDAQNGKDVVTTLDISIQDVAEHALMSVLQQYECLYGTCIVMEVQTGKIKALVNLGRQKDGSYWEDLNYAMMPTEPGSTFKLVTLLSLFNDKYVNVNSKVDCQGGVWNINGRTLHDSHAGLGVLSIRDAFAHSSNVGMAKLAYQYYSSNPQKYVDHLYALHLNDRTHIDLSGERPPVVKSPKNTSWSATSLPWMAYGYEIQITPLHTCMVYNAVANGGRMMRPYLVSEIREYGKTIKKIEPKAVVESVGDTSVINQLQTCMKEVVLTGTAKHIKSPFYGIAGKTGTAQVADKGIKYTDGVYQGSFVGYFPTDKPKYTIAVVVRTKPHSSAYYGGTIAAPVFRMIADKVFSESKGWDGPLDSLARVNKNYGIPAQIASAKSYDLLFRKLHKNVEVGAGNQLMKLNADSSKNIMLKPAAIYAGIVPDVSGLGLKDAVYMLEKEGMKVTVRGRGKVQMQSVAPGTKIFKGQSILLQLS